MITRRAALASGAAALAATAQPARAQDTGFWKLWGDGQAELASYDLTKPHDKELRRGLAISIFAAETFSNSLRVKAEPGKHPKSDEFSVMKLNLMKDLQTGISNTHDQLSAFLSLAPVNGRPAGFLTKASFSSQDWLGSLYHQLLFDQKTIRSTRHSYLDGEGDQQQEIDYPPAATSEDALWFWARRIAEPYVKRGEYRLMQILSSLESQRDNHKPLAWKQAKFTRSPVDQRLTLPAGVFDVELCTAQIDDDIRKFWVERAFPNRVVRWETSAGERGQLLATERMKYWQMTGKGGEENLKRLKLLPRPPRTT